MNLATKLFIVKLILLAKSAKDWLTEVFMTTKICELEGEESGLWRSDQIEAEHCSEQPINISSKPQFHSILLNKCGIIEEILTLVFDS